MLVTELRVLLMGIAEARTVRQARDCWVDNADVLSAS